MEPIEHILDADARALEARVERALQTHGADCQVRRRTHWYTSRPPMHEAVLLAPRTRG
jgi:hypothetical protein